MRPLRRTMWAAAVLAITALPLSAQFVPKKGEVLVGATVGANRASLAGPGATNTGPTIGYQFGGVITRQLFEKLFVRTGGGYVRRGASMRDTSFDASTRVSYVEFPLLAGFELARQGHSPRPYVLVGFNLALQLGCSMEVGQYPSTQQFDCNDPSIQPQPQVNGTDFIGVLGAGFAFSHRNKQGPRLELLYTAGSRNVQQGVNAKNRGLSIGMVLMVPPPTP